MIKIPDSKIDGKRILREIRLMRLMENDIILEIWDLFYDEEEE